jgi:4-diphosphocytidyl-2-C-methyl-D-erythritol kinase
VLINSYAKINLYLDVLNKRSDGYHEIETLFSTIDLYDSLKFVLTKKPEIQILSNVPELASVNNLVNKIAQRILSDFEVNQGIKVHLIKRIPISAGLGGGSSNAAMTFIALNALLGLNMEERYMHSVASEYGSDINFFFSGGLALGKSRGELICPMPDADELDLLLVNPGIAISSGEAYQLVKVDARNSAAKKMWYNSLEKGIAVKYPMIEDTLRKLKELGADESMMSGSGSTCIGLYKNKAGQLSAAAYFDTKKMWNKCVKTLNRSRYQQCFLNLN